MSTIPRAWRDGFVATMRLRGADAATIGAALAEVEAHCADSGQPPLAAFGPADAYAASLPMARQGGAAWVSRTLGAAMACFLLGYLVMSFNTRPSAEGSGDAIHWGLGSLLALALAGAVPATVGALRPRLGGRRSGMVLIAASCLALLLWLTLRDEVATTAYIPTMWLAVALALLGAVVASLLSWRAAPRDPLTGRVARRDRLMALMLLILLAAPVAQAVSRLT